MKKGKSWDEEQHRLHLDNYRRQCEGLEGGASHTLASAPRSTAPSSVRSCHGKVGCACKHSFFFLPFFFSKGAFPFLSYCYVTVDREPPQEETIPFSSTRMRSSPSTDYLNGQRKATERKEREKKIKTSPPLRRGLRRYHSTRYEVTPSSVHTRAYTYVHAYVHETGERGGVGERETEEERERESLYPPRFETSLRQAGLLDSTEDSRYSYPPFSAVPPSPGRE